MVCSQLPTLGQIETEKKWVVRNCVEVFTLHRDKASKQFLIGFCANLSVSPSLFGCRAV